MIQDLWRDLSHTVRSLRNSPGFTLVAGLVLALGIGASTAMFSVLDGVLLRRLPIQAQDEVMVIWNQAEDRSTGHLPVSYRDLTAFQEHSRVFASVAGINFQGAVEIVMLDAGGPVRLNGSWATGGFFPMLGIAPIHGRTLLPSDDVPGAAPVMVISHGFWQRYFGGRPSAVGRSLQKDGKRYAVVGILPPGLEFPKGTDAWFAAIPAFPATVDQRVASSPPIEFDLVGRLSPGASPATAIEDYAGFLRRTDPGRPAAGRGMRPVVTPLASIIAGEVRPILVAAAAAVGLILLIASINVANLLLIRGSSRTQELAIRTALGAGRRRLVRQLMVESGVIALGGGLAGVLLATGAVRILVAIAPPELPRRELISIDSRVLFFAVGITGITALLSGILPAVLAASGDLGEWLRGGRSAVTGGRRGQRLRAGLVVGQISLAILVVTSAGLFTRSLIALETVEMGFNDRRLLIGETAFPAELAPERERQLQLQEEMLRRIAAIPGVQSATAMPKPPFSGMRGWLAMYSGAGQTPKTQAANPWVSLEVVGADYFRTFEIPILRGRDFAPEDRGRPVAIISEAIARHTWPGEDPIGKRITLGPLDTPGEWPTVIGVVGETRYADLQSPKPSLYIPTRQFPGPVPMTLALRTSGEPLGVVSAIRSALRDVHPDLQLASGGSMTQLAAAPLARPRFTTLLLAAFGTITLVLAVVGIYGALAATVRERRREVGIRLALGATAGEIRALVMSQGIRLALWGFGIGTVAAVMGTRLLRGLLFEISPTDPLTYLGVAVVVLGAAAAASYIPARRISRVSPLSTLRSD